MMFLLYVYLALLPTAETQTTEAQTRETICDDNSAFIIFAAIDANNDDAVDPGESFGVYDFTDVNGDRRVTVDEFEQAAIALSPELRGFGAGLLDFQDFDRDGVFTRCDLEIQFEIVDENKNGVLNLDEFKRFVDRFCQRNQTEYAKK